MQRYNSHIFTFTAIYGTQESKLWAVNQTERYKKWKKFGKKLHTAALMIGQRNKHIQLTHQLDYSRLTKNRLIEKKNPYNNGSFFWVKLDSLFFDKTSRSFQNNQRGSLPTKSHVLLFHWAPMNAYPPRRRNCLKMDMSTLIRHENGAFQAMTITQYNSTKLIWMNSSTHRPGWPSSRFRLGPKIRTSRKVPSGNNDKIYSLFYATALVRALIFTLSSIKDVRPKSFQHWFFSETFTT